MEGGGDVAGTEDGFVEDLDGVVVDVGGLAPEDRGQRTAERLRLGAQAGHLTLYDRDLNTDTFVWMAGTEGFGYAASEVGPNVAWWEERLHPTDRERVLITLQAARALSPRS